MSTSSPVIAIKTEPIGSATRVIGTVDGREMICISNSAEGVWVVGGSSCLPADLRDAAACLECMR